MINEKYKMGKVYILFHTVKDIPIVSSKMTGVSLKSDIDIIFSAPFSTNMPIVLDTVKSETGLG